MGLKGCSAGPPINKWPQIFLDIKHKFFNFIYILIYYQKKMPKALKTIMILEKNMKKQKSYDEHHF